MSTAALNVRPRHAFSAESGGGRCPAGVKLSSAGRLSGTAGGIGMMIIGHLGRETMRLVNHMALLSAYTVDLLSYLVRRPKVGRSLVRRIALEQIYFTAVQALWTLIPVALIIGSAFIVQFTKLSGQYELGNIVVLLIIRESGPAITALLIILRSATAVTIETSYMKIFHEIDALEMSGMDPVWIICVPRLIGITSAILGLFIIFDIVAIIGGYAVVWMFSYLPIGGFLHQIAKAVTLTEIAVGLIKAGCFGIIITVISTYYGLNVEKKITEIPIATSIAAVEGFFFCLIANILISALFYL